MGQRELVAAGSASFDELRTGRFDRLRQAQDRLRQAQGRLLRLAQDGVFADAGVTEGKE